VVDGRRTEREPAGGVSEDGVSADGVYAEDGWIAAVVHRWRAERESADGVAQDADSADGIAQDGIAAERAFAEYWGRGTAGFARRAARK
jgi:hypothetical protein